MSTATIAADTLEPATTATFSWRRVFAVVRRQGLVQYRNPGMWFLLFVLPVVDAVLFASIGVAYGDGTGPVRVLFTGIMLFHLVWQLTLAGSLGFLEEVWSRNVLNLFTTPLRELEYAVSLLVVGLLRTVVAVGMIAAVGGGLYALDPASAGWVLVPAAAVLLLFGWAVALLVVGLTLQYGDSAEVFSWGTLVLLMPLSGVFYPVEALPGVLQTVARAIPLTRAFDATRIGIEGGSLAVGDLAVAAAGSAVAVGVAFWFVLRQLRRFREQGWVTRFT
ncbi:MAG: ABC transporter permease [Acidimicrobiales bacterium]|nr:ABC transporter permease [Acidimicrobiales bacterium]